MIVFVMRITHSSFECEEQYSVTWRSWRLITVISEALLLLVSDSHEVALLASLLLLAKFEGSHIFLLQFTFLDFAS